MTEHTPTLIVQDGDIWDTRLDGSPGIPLFRADHEYRRWGRDITREEKERLAARIVRAVNSHDALKAALEALVELDDGDNPALWPHAELFEAARRALTEA